MKTFIILGAINAFISVALGAFGAHGLEGKISEHYMSVWEKAVSYQMYHALGLMAVGILVQATGAPLLPCLRRGSLGSPVQVGDGLLRALLFSGPSSALLMHLSLLPQIYQRD